MGNQYFNYVLSLSAGSVMKLSTPNDKKIFSSS